MYLHSFHILVTIFVHIEMLMKSIVMIAITYFIVLNNLLTTIIVSVSKSFSHLLSNKSFICLKYHVFV